MVLLFYLKVVLLIYYPFYLIYLINVFTFIFETLTQNYKIIPMQAFTFWNVNLYQNRSARYFILADIT